MPWTILISPGLGKTVQFFSSHVVGRTWAPQACAVSCGAKKEEWTAPQAWGKLYRPGEMRMVQRISHLLQLYTEA